MHKRVHGDFTHSGTAHICWNKLRGCTASRPISGDLCGRAGGKAAPPAVRPGPGGSPCRPEHKTVPQNRRRPLWSGPSSSSPLGKVGSCFQRKKQAGPGPDSGARSGAQPCQQPDAHRAIGLQMWQSPSKSSSETHRGARPTNQQPPPRGVSDDSKQMRLDRPSVVRLCL